ncbi:magnesium/cobalt transporter CorA [Piscinibacter sp. XHJ-5]|uniref:magnesium/cobalt transporter CorA n=1 Tax=Piscinibacter sp. XHJ-5 TaxID=3037797 RepID=UPI002452EC49|nr:magnesium/cobalt transporter CorA [Piscinibacter sp. XHJ-5]
MLINCVAYQDGKKLADIPVGDISDYLNRPGCFVWVALRDATEPELLVMQREFALHDLAVEDARHGHQRPKVEEYADMLFAVVHTVEFSATDELRVGEVNLFVGRNFILSIRNRSTQHLLGVRERAEREPHLLKHGSGYVLYAVMDAVVDRYFPIIDALESELENIEGQIFVRGSARANIEHLYQLKGRIMTVRHAVTPLMESASKLWSGRVPSVCEGSREYFRDVYDHLVRINGALDTLRDTIGTAIQVNLSMVTIEESETTKQLAAWAGIFAIATAFAGIWGMNFEHMPELKWKFGYPMALGTIVVACSLLWRRFRRLGWL